ALDKAMARFTLGLQRSTSHQDMRILQHQTRLILHRHQALTPRPSSFSKTAQLQVQKFLKALEDIYNNKNHARKHGSLTKLRVKSGQLLEDDVLNSRIEPLIINLQLLVDDCSRIDEADAYLRLATIVNGALEANSLFYS